MILNMATDVNTPHEHTPHASTFLNSSTSLLSVCLLWHIWCGWTHLCGCWLRHIIYSRQTFLSWLFHVWVVTLDQQQEEDTVNRPGNKQYTACVCVCVGLELHNDTDLLPHCCILVHGRTHTHTHTQWVWLLRGVPCTDRHTSDKLRPGLTQVEENI